MATEAPDPAPPAAQSLWLAPSHTPAGKSSIALAVEDLAAGRAASALPVLEHAARAAELDGYAQLYLGRAQLALNKIGDARATAARLLESQPTGYLADAAQWLSADVSEAAEDWASAMDTLRTFAQQHPLDPQRVTLRLGQIALRAHDNDAAIAAFRDVYLDYPLSGEAEDAGANLVKLDVNLVPDSAPAFARLQKRAQRLFDAKAYADARASFVLLSRAGGLGDQALVTLRIGESDYYLKHYAAARDELRPLAGAQPEADFFSMSALRPLGRTAEYIVAARAFADAHPDDPLAEEALNDLATYYVLAGDDGTAASVLEELYARFPAGAHADRAAWRAGWWKYKAGDYAAAIRFFESAAVTFPHADYRPSWLYWAARAHQRLGERDLAAAGFRRVIADYRNSYYGRQAARAMTAVAPGAAGVELVRRALPALAPGLPPANAGVIRDLLEAGLYDSAILEIRKAESLSGSSPLLDATMAYALNRKGELRAAIIRMRRAYPQFLSDGGEQLPAEIRRVIFPVAYWSTITRYAKERNLDPYLMAALVAQESTFEADVKSSAGAWGLMQIMPGTGRQVAAHLQISFTTARLKQPDVNVRIGMATFSSLVGQFGGIAPALAAYNAGDSRVTKWLAERHGLEQDEFIDDIPFPETQNYVKRILGTAEDYRALYGEASGGEIVEAAVRTASAAPVKPAVRTAAPVRPASSVKPAATRTAAAVKSAPKRPASKAAPAKAAPKSAAAKKKARSTRTASSQ